MSDKRNFTSGLRPMRHIHHQVVREVYSDAIFSQGSCFYSNEQIDAWAALAYVPGVLDQLLDEGSGWLVFQRNIVEAFAVRHPFNRLALLYCRGRSSRQGFATRLLQRIELDASLEGISVLSTEASYFSYPLLLKSGWIEKSIEKIEIAGVRFDRYRMQKYLPK